MKKVILGFVADKLGGYSIVAVSCIALIISVIALVGANYLPVAILNGLLHGFGTSFGSLGPPIITRQLFGEKDYNNIMAVVSISSGIGMAIGAPFCGIIYDLTGGYTVSWIIFLIAMVGATVLFLVSLKKEKKMLKVEFIK